VGHLVSEKDQGEEENILFAFSQDLFSSWQG
jgi:hypothetical protein